MYSRYCLGVFLIVAVANIVSALSPTDHPLTAQDTIGHFPGADIMSNTIYPGMLPPGYVYTRRVRRSGFPEGTSGFPNGIPSTFTNSVPSYGMLNYPGGYSYHRRISTSGNPYPVQMTYPGGYSYRRTYRYNNGDNSVWPVYSEYNQNM